MDASIVFLGLGQMLGIPLLILGGVLSIPKRSRWFALPVVVFAILGGAIATVTDAHLVMYTRSTLFWSAFTLIALVLGTASAATAIIVALANGKPDPRTVKPE